MGIFTKKRLKNSKEIIKGIKKGDLSIIKKEFSVNNTKETVIFAAEVAGEIKGKIEELKVVHHKVFHNLEDEWIPNIR